MLSKVPGEVVEMVEVVEVVLSFRIPRFCPA